MHVPKAYNALADFRDGRLDCEVLIYTDGACHPNPGPGGWAAILLYMHKGQLIEHELSGGDACTTNNRMEIVAVLSGLEALKRPARVQVVSDSKYVCKSIGDWANGHPDLTELGGWVPMWRARNWKNAEGKPVLNQDLWERALDIAPRLPVLRMRHVRGHQGDEYNERCDVLAVAQKRLYQQG